MRKLLLLAFIVAIGGYFAWPYAFTVVPIDDDGAPGEFDPVGYVDGIWEQLDTTTRQEAVELSEILAAIRPDAAGRAQKEDLATVADQFGLITAGEAHVYMVRATGTITELDTDTSLGTIELDVDGYDGPIVARIYVGPRIPSDESSVRDAVGFITFGTFREQTEYGRVSSEINRRVITMLSALDGELVQGASIGVVGAMTIRTFNLVEIDVSRVNIVPLEIDVR
ncbi:MAG: DUF2291 family protein [Gemmatimonadaceae bacterium]|nr:DUF2291 family protein [Gemmatimonadaceae bacterium]